MDLRSSAAELVASLKLAGLDCNLPEPDGSHRAAAATVTAAAPPAEYTASAGPLDPSAAAPPRRLCAPRRRSPRRVSR
jgi:hypothetical protein